MKKLIYISLMLLGYGCLSQTNPDYHRYGARTPFIQLDTLTTAQKTALTIPTNRTVFVYDKTIGELQWYNLDTSSWEALGSGGSGATNLSTAQTATSVTINSDTGTDATIPLGNGANADVSNATIQNNTFNVEKWGFKIFNVNDSLPNNKFTIKDNLFLNKDQNISNLSNVEGAILIGNTVDSGVEIFNSNNLSLIGNTITTTKKDAIDLRQLNTNILLQDNIFSTLKNCIKVESTTDITEITETNNTCN